MENLGVREKAIKGVVWTGLSQVGTQILAFLIMVILARALLPKDFGILGMATIFTGLVMMLNEIGLGAAIVQRKTIDENHLSTVFWVSIIVGLISWMIAAITSPFVANFFRNPQVRPVIMVISIGFTIGPLGVIHKTLLNKQLDFKKLAFTEVGAALIYGLTSIILALKGYGVWSLVFGLLAQSFTEVILLWKVCPWRPRARFHSQSFRELFSFGINVWGFNLVNYGRENIDYFIIGRALGSAALGFYTLAYTITNIPRRRLMSIVSKVAFPTFAKVQNQNEKLRYGYLKVISYTSLITFPILAGLTVVAPEFVLFVYGSKWVPMVLPLQILCGAGMLYSIGSPVGSIFLAKGRPDIQFKLSLVSVLALTIFVLAGVSYGIVGVATAVLAYAVIFVWVTQWFANSLIGLRMRDYLLSLLPASVSSLTMVFILVSYRYLRTLVLDMSSTVWLFSSVTFGIIIYVSALRIFKIEEFYEIVDLLRNQITEFVDRARNRKILVKPVSEKLR